MCCLVLRGSLTARFKVDDATTGTNQVNDANELRQSVTTEISFNRHLDSFGTFICLDGTFEEVGFEERPRLLLVIFLFAVPIDLSLLWPAFVEQCLHFFCL